MILCSGTLGAIPFVVKARAAALAGYEGISIYTHEYEPGVRSVLDDLGLSVAEVDGPTAWLPGHPGVDPARAIEIAHDVGARSISVFVRGAEAPDPALAGDALAAFCRAADPLVVHIEPFAWSTVASLSAAADIVERAAEHNAGIILDTWHLARGPDAGRLSSVDRIVAVQVSDPTPQPWSSVRDECMHGRLPPGPFTDSILRQLPQLPVEVEVFADDFIGRDPVDVARSVKSNW